MRRCLLVETLERLMKAKVKRGRKRFQMIDAIIEKRMCAIAERLAQNRAT